MRKHTLPSTHHGREGYALMTVLVFVLVLLIAGAGFFAMSFYETKATLYRQESAEAFYLADGAIERARAQFIASRAWRTGWADTACGRGTYSLSVRDTAVTGHPNAVRLLADGRVLRAHRRVEVLADIPVSAFELTTLVGGTATIKGNLHIIGPFHANGGFSIPGHGHLQEGCDTSSTYRITPPQMFTGPTYFPGATYYYVCGHDKTGLGPYYARILDGAGVDITRTVSADSLIDVINYSSSTFTYSFDNDSKIGKYFNTVTGVFRPRGGATYAVVNFGETAIMTPPMDTISDVEFDGDDSLPNSDIHATIINTRFWGTTDEQRLDPLFWKGGLTTIRQAVFEPYGGLALLVRNLMRPGGAQGAIGSSTWPAFVYVTNDLQDWNSNAALVGCIVVLGNWTTTGGLTVTFDRGFLANIPDYLKDHWQNNVSGTLTVLRWREVPAS